MRLDRARIEPTTPHDWDDDSRPVLHAVEPSPDRPIHIFRTLARHPKLLKRWMVFGNHVLNGSTLPARERELVILRTGYLCGSGYEWVQHVAIGRRSGLADHEIERLATPSGGDGWTSGERALIDATDQLVADQFVADGTWHAVREAWSERQAMDLVFTVGQYVLVSMALNTFGVQIEPGMDRFPARLFRHGAFQGVRGDR